MRKRPRCRVCGSVAGALGTNRSAGGGKLDRRERPVHAGLGDARDLMLKGTMAWRSCAWAEDIATAAHALDHSGQEDGRNGMIKRCRVLGTTHAVPNLSFFIAYDFQVFHRQAVIGTLFPATAVVIRDMIGSVS